MQLNRYLVCFLFTFLVKKYIFLKTEGVQKLRTDGQMDGLTDGRMDGWTNGQMDRWTVRRINGRINEQANRGTRQTGRWTDGRISRRAGKWADLRMGRQADRFGGVYDIYFYRYVILFDYSNFCQILTEKCPCLSFVCFTSSRVLILICI